MTIQEKEKLSEILMDLEAIRRDSFSVRHGYITISKIMEKLEKLRDEI